MQICGREIHVGPGERSKQPHLPSPFPRAASGPLAPGTEGHRVRGTAQGLSPGAKPVYTRLSCSIALAMVPVSLPPSSLGAPDTCPQKEILSPMEDSQSQIPLLPPQIPADMVIWG